MCGSMYSYILCICHYAPNTFSTLVNFTDTTNIGEYHNEKVSSHDYSPIYVRTHKNVDEYSVFAYSQRIYIYAVPPLHVIIPEMLCLCSAGKTDYFSLHWDNFLM